MPTSDFLLAGDGETEKFPVGNKENLRFLPPAFFLPWLLGLRNLFNLRLEALVSNTRVGWARLQHTEHRSTGVLEYLPSRLGGVETDFVRLSDHHLALQQVWFHLQLHLAAIHRVQVNVRRKARVTPLHGGVLDPPGLWCQTDLPLIRNTVGRPVLLWSGTFQRLPTGLLLGDI